MSESRENTADRKCTGWYRGRFTGAGTRGQMTSLIEGLSLCQEITGVLKCYNGETNMCEGSHGRAGRTVAKQSLKDERDLFALD